MKVSEVIDLLNRELANGDVEVSDIDLPQTDDGEVIDLRYCSLVQKK